MFSWWHRVRDGTLERSSLQTYISDLRLRFRLRLWQGELLADEKTARTCANLAAIEPALWTLSVRKVLSPRTTPPSERCATGCCGARAASAPTVLRAAASSSAYSPCATRCANSNATYSTTSRRPPDAKLSQWLLERKWPELYSRKHIEVSATVKSEDPSPPMRLIVIDQVETPPVPVGENEKGPEPDAPGPAGEDDD